MSPPAELSPWRRRAATLALGAVGVGFAALGIADARHGFDWPAFGAAALAGGGALLYLKRDLWAQVLARGVAHFYLAISGLIAGVSMIDGRLETWALPVVAGTAASLLLARPALHTPEARAAFAPAAMRRVFLAGAVASVSASLLAGLLALGFTFWPMWAMGAAFASLAGAMLASAWGVVRMRTWGVLLGGLASIVTLGAAVVESPVPGWAIAPAALPGLLLVAAVVAARRRAARQLPTPARRVAAAGAAEIRLRIATTEDEEDPVEPSADAARASTIV
jgi:hypothetical protein